MRLFERQGEPTSGLRSHVSTREGEQSLSTVEEPSTTGIADMTIPELKDYMDANTISRVGLTAKADLTAAIQATF